MTLPKVAGGEFAPAVEIVRHHLADLAKRLDLALPELMRRVCEAASDSLRVERAGIWLFVNGDKALRCVSLFERGKRKHSKGTCLSLAECPAFTRALTESPLVPSESALVDPRTTELSASYLAPLRVGSALYAPLQRDGRTIGAVFLEHVGSPRSWSDTERSLALDLAKTVVERMKAAEGVLRAPPRAHFVLAAPVAPVPASTPPRIAYDLKLLFTEIEVLARTGRGTGSTERLARIAEAASRGLELVRGLFEAQAETAEHETLPATNDDDTGEHVALPSATGS